MSDPNQLDSAAAYAEIEELDTDQLYHTPVAADSNVHSAGFTGFDRYSIGRGRIGLERFNIATQPPRGRGRSPGSVQQRVDDLNRQAGQFVENSDTHQEHILFRDVVKL